MVSIREWNRSHRKQEAYTKPQGMTNDGLLFKLHAIDPIGSADPFVQFKAMQPLWTTEVTTELGGSDTKTDASYVEF